MRCPESAGQRTQVRGIGFVATEPVLTYILIGVNVAVALGGLLSGASATGGGGLGGSSLIGNLAVSRAEVADGEYWRILTSGFVHSGFLHLAFNMFALYILGGMLEPVIGRLRFGLIYFVSLLCGSFGALLLEPTLPTVGASGAIFGLMGAAVFVLRSRGISLMESGLGLWIGLNLLLTFTVSNISVGGHIAGLVGGSITALLLLNIGDRTRLPAYVPELVAAALGAVAVAAAIAVSS
jgi:membrane associated rhomboid family serine protease